MRYGRTVVAVAILSLALCTFADDKPVLIRNASLIVTMDPALGSGPLGTIENADVLFDRSGILAVGPNLTHADAEIVDGTNRIVMPGFVDTHDHLLQSGIRGCGTDHDLIGWLARCAAPLRTVGLSDAEAYALTRLSTLGLISTGVTTTVDWESPASRGVAEGLVRALSDSGMRFQFACRPAFIGGATELRRIKRELLDPNPLAALQVAAAPLPAELSASGALARELGVLLHVHVLENIAQRGENQWAALVGSNALGPNLFMAHAIHLSDDEIAQAAAAGARVGHNPLSNMRLASGIIRFPELPNAGIRIGLGLDGGTNDTTDAFNNMRAAVGLQRVKTLSASAYPTVADVLRMATLGGAEALGQSDRIGSLTPGKQADVIVIDAGGINFAPRIDWLSQLVFNGQPSNVERVYVAGRALKANGQLVGVNERKIVADAEAAASRIGAALPR